MNPGTFTKVSKVLCHSQNYFDPYPYSHFLSFLCKFLGCDPPQHINHFIVVQLSFHLTNLVDEMATNPKIEPNAMEKSMIEMFETLRDEMIDDRKILTGMRIRVEQKLHDVSNEIKRLSKASNAGSSTDLVTCKTKCNEVVPKDGTIYNPTPRTCDWFIIYVGCPAIERLEFHQDFCNKFRLPYDLFLSMVREILEHAAFSQWSNKMDCTGIANFFPEVLLVWSNIIV